MFQNAKLDLVKDSSLKSGYISSTYSSSNFNFEFKAVMVPHTSEEALVGMTNEVKASQVLCTRLSQQSWDLYVRFEPIPVHKQLVEGLRVTVEGGLLKELLSLMSYGVEDAWLKLKLKADLAMYKNKYRSTERIYLGNFCYETGLFPCTLRGHYDHSKYETSRTCPADCFKAKLDTDADDGGCCWEVSNVHLWVEGVEFDVKKIGESQAKKAKAIFQELGHGPELEIICKSEEGEDDGPQLPPQKTI